MWKRLLSKKKIVHPLKKVHETVSLACFQSQEVLFHGVNHLTITPSNNVMTTIFPTPESVILTIIALSRFNLLTWMLL